MSHKILAELCADPWVMEPRALEALLARLQSNAEPAADGRERVDRLRARAGGDVAPPRVSFRDGVATVPISGVLLQRASLARELREWWGMDCTAYSEIQEDLEAAAAAPGVHTIRLAVESPGGQVAGGMAAADAIHSMRGRKRVVAETHSMMASGAYWLGSQAHEIVAGPNAMVGSIGVYSAIVDSEKLASEWGLKVHLVASGPQKGAGFFGTHVTDEQVAGLRSIVEGLAANFRADVGRGRGKSPEVVSGWATGATWLGAEAAAKGLVDRVERDTTKAISAPPGVPAAAIPSTTSQGETMDPATLAAAEAKGEAAARKRYDDLKAAFPKDAAFAFEAWQKGWSVTEARAEYSAVLQQRLDASTTERAALEAKLAAGAEGSAIPSKGADVRPQAQAPKDALTAQRQLIAHAQGLQREHMKVCPERALQPQLKHPCCSLRMALGQARADRPELVEVTKAAKREIGIEE